MDKKTSLRLDNSLAANVRAAAQAWARRKEIPAERMMATWIRSVLASAADQELRMEGENK